MLIISFQKSWGVSLGVKGAGGAASLALWRWGVVLRAASVDGVLLAASMDGVLRAASVGIALSPSASVVVLLKSNFLAYYC
jgi:hypothetical protein